MLTLCSLVLGNNNKKWSKWLQNVTEKWSSSNTALFSQITWLFCWGPFPIKFLPCGMFSCFDNDFFLLPPCFLFAFKHWLSVKHQVTYLLCLLSFPCLWFLWSKHISCSRKANLGAHALTESQTYALSSCLPFDTLVETWMHWPSYVSQSILANRCSLQRNQNGQKLIQIHLN